MSDAEILQKLREMAKHYDSDWTLEDLRNDLEEIFMALDARDSRV